MAVHYEIAHSLAIEDIISVAFSPSGSKLAAVTLDGSIHVLHIETGKEYYPTPRRSTAQPTRIIWLDDATYACTFTNGYLLSAQMECKPEESDSLDIEEVKISDNVVQEVAFNPKADLLAVGEDNGAIRLWKRGLSEWTHVLDLPGCSRDDGEIISLSWVLNREESDRIAVAFMKKGLIIWDVAKQRVKRSLEAKSGTKLHAGTFCSLTGKFAAINDHNLVDVYDIDSGEIWSPPILKDFSVIQSIHNGSGFIAGGFGQSHVVDIVGTCIWQVLVQDYHSSQGNEDKCKIKAIDTYQNTESQTFLIATASHSALNIWKTREKKGPQEFQTGPFTHETVDDLRTLRVTY